MKEDKKKEFESCFLNAYGDKFLLLPVEQAFEDGLFGPGERHPSLMGPLGDYLAVAIDRDALFPTEDGCHSFAGHHSGLTINEMEIPLIIVDRK